MAIVPADPERYRRQQRRRGVLGWLVGVGFIALAVLSIVLGAGETHHLEEVVAVPPGEIMTSSQYDEIETGESQADVLTHLGKAGRPEDLTEGYVLVLFPPASDDVQCTYWEFSDEPEIFARLCFDREGGQLVEKQDANVHSGLPAGAGSGNIV